MECSMPRDPKDKPAAEAVRRPPLKRPEPRKDRRSKTPSVPRLQHGTRVAFQIECASCGKSDTLPYVPKTTGDVMCRACAAEQLGEGWDRGRVDLQQREAATIACAICTAEFETTRPPDERDGLLCPRCHRGEAKPNPGRIGERIRGKRVAVKRKRSNEPA